jgi:glutaminyl-peptide cyclotransferase
MPNIKLTFVALVLPALALLAACKSEQAAPAADTAEGATKGTASAPAATPGTSVPTYGYTVVATAPHDPQAFTEGLFIKDGKVYEGTGQEGKSWISRWDLATGAVELRRELPPPYFGEGISIVGDRLYELTWKHGKAFVYDAKTFKPLDTLSYYGQGWGMTTDGESLYMDDSTSRIRVLDPKTFAVKRTIDVHDGSSPVSMVNELEWYKGELLANVWQSMQIARIDPKTGAVTGWIDLTGLPLPADKTGNEDVLNGIAYDARNDKLWVTGKNYAKMYQIEIKAR